MSDCEPCVSGEANSLILRRGGDINRYHYWEYDSACWNDQRGLYFGSTDNHDKFYEKPLPIIIDETTVGDRWNTRLKIRLDTEGLAATDDLITINGGREGQIINFFSSSDSRIITFRHAVGNILLGGADIAINTRAEFIKLRKEGAFWVLIEGFIIDPCKATFVTDDGDCLITSAGELFVVKIC